MITYSRLEHPRIFSFSRSVFVIALDIVGVESQLELAPALFSPISCQRAVVCMYGNSFLTNINKLN